jgi:hypothetical protein
MTLDFDRDMPLTEEDQAAMRRSRRLPTSPAQYEALLDSLKPLSAEDLARRKGPRGEPFEL